jgi:hypothetical protein
MKNLALAILALAGASIPAVCMAQSVAPSDPSIRRFNENVAAYLDLRHRVSAGLAPATLTANPRTLVKDVDELAARIRAARQGAREGDILTEDLGRLLRTRISETLRADGIGPAALLASDRRGTSPIPRRDLAVNRHYEWNSGWEVPADLLGVLPPLPQALQYTVVNRDLLIVDIDADLVVDILRAAIPGR